MNTYDRIKKIRKDRGWTQTDLALRCGYADKSMIARVENGQIDIHMSKLKDIAAALQVDPAYLLGCTEDAMLEDLLDTFYDMNEEGKEKLCDYARLLSSSGSYKKRDFHDVVGQK